MVDQRQTFTMAENQEEMCDNITSCKEPVVEVLMALQKEVLAQLATSWG